MASVAIPANSPLVTLLRTHSPSSLPAAPAVSTDDYPSADISKALFPNVRYSEAEKEDQNAWLTTSIHIVSPAEDEAKTSERLAQLNSHLASRTTILGSKPSIADVALYAKLAPVVKGWSPEERSGENGYHHIVRHVALVQGSTIFGLSCMSEDEKVHIDENQILVPIKPVDPKAEKERKKKEKEATAAGTEPNGVATEESIAGATSGGRKAKKEAKAAAATQQLSSTDENAAASVGGATAAAGAAGATAAQAPEGSSSKRKEKAPKPKKAQPEPVKDAPLSPALIDLRVGHILKAERHPNADSLYVSTIACGDTIGADNTSEYEGQVVRTVCSGLNGLIPLEDMQNRKIVAVCNLKPVKMRGVLSAAMVLAASPRVTEGDDSHAGPVELVSPPEAAVAGDKVNFEGWEGQPEGQLNPKKKVWEICQVGFTTTPDCEVAFDASAVSQLEGKTGLSKLKTNAGVCTVKSLKGATVR